MPARRRVAALALTLIVAPLLAAPKCFEYSGPMGMDSTVPESGTMDAAPSDAPEADTGATFVPAVPCPTAGTAAFIVRNLQYQIVCGCVEASGRVCTVPRGTTVTWSFADAVEHNVSPVEHAFDGSTDRISGRHTHRFDEPGTFGYGCTLHPAAMSGYSLVVQ